MGYVYDMGDHWMHDIRLVSLYPAEESTACCQVFCYPQSSICIEYFQQSLSELWSVQYCDISIDISIDIHNIV